MRWNTFMNSLPVPRLFNGLHEVSTPRCLLSASKNYQRTVEVFSNIIMHFRTFPWSG